MEETYTSCAPQPSGEEARRRQSSVAFYSPFLSYRKHVAVVSLFLALTLAVTLNYNDNTTIIRGISIRDRFLLRKGNNHKGNVSTEALPLDETNNSDYTDLIDSSCTVDCCKPLLESKHLHHRRTESEDEDGNSWVKKVPFPLQMVLIVVLILNSALFSGLTLGLMGLDKIGLEIVMEGDDPEASRAARKIYPIRSNGNLLLCTLLLGNVAVNAMLSILMADISGGLIGFFVSTISIVIFGEILPQAACSRYALQIGSRAIPVVKVIQILFWPISAPIAYALDKILGHELGTTYSKAEMSKLLEIHVKEGRFNQETGNVMTGALKYQDVTVKEVMTSLEHTFMLDADEKFSFETITKVFKTGFSRIPVYEVSMNNIIGLLFVKDLIFIDPEDETPVKNFVQIFGRGAHVVWPDDRLGDVLRKLKGGHSHMALVRDVNNDDETQDPFYEIKGIITLEDIIEIILGDEIVDETDAWVDGEQSVKVDRTVDFDWAKLRLLDSKIVDETLSQEEVRAISAHLRTNHSSAVQLLSDKQLNRMITLTPVTVLQASEMDIGNSLPDNLLYEKGKPCGFCTLILSGKVTVLAGSDNFRSDISSWCVLAANALTNKSYAPDFNAYVTGESCRCLIFTRHNFSAAIDSSAVEKITSNRSPTSNLLRNGTNSNESGEICLDDGNVDKKINNCLSTSLHREDSAPDARLVQTEEDSLKHGPNCHGKNIGLIQRKAVREHRSKLLNAFYRKTSKKLNQHHPEKEDSGTKIIESNNRNKDAEQISSLQNQLSDGGHLRPRSSSISKE